MLSPRVGQGKLEVLYPGGAKSLTLGSPPLEESHVSVKHMSTPLSIIKALIAERLSFFFADRLSVKNRG